jgi:probable addiction module antidote protein
MSKFMKSKLKKWDAAEHLKTKKDMVAYMACALEEGDSALIAAALGDIARAQGMSKIAKKSGLGRESLYKTLSVDGNPALATILKVVNALGLKLQAVPA